MHSWYQHVFWTAPMNMVFLLFLSFLGITHGIAKEGISQVSLRRIIYFNLTNSVESVLNLYNKYFQGYPSDDVSVGWLSFDDSSTRSKANQIKCFRGYSWDSFSQWTTTGECFIRNFLIRYLFIHKRNTRPFPGCFHISGRISNLKICSRGD